MASTIIDGLLDLVRQQGADSLTLDGDSPPVLSRSGARQRLSMPALGEEMLEQIVVEVTGEDERARLEASGELTTVHENPSGAYTVTIRRSGGGLQLTAVARASGPRSDKAERASNTTVGARRAEAAHRREPGKPSNSPGDREPDAPSGSRSEPAADWLTTLLDRAQLEGASDILVATGSTARLRINGRLEEVPGATIDDAALERYFEPVWAQIAAELEGSGSVDFAWTDRGARYRANVFRRLGGLAAALRPIRSDPPTLESLGLDPRLYELTRFRSGLVLMTGPTGVGKSTTLVALLERVNRTEHKHVITIEDPIEYVYPDGTALFNQRELGTHVVGFADGLRAALRESPDIILVGEMRDRDTIAAALTAAETGHLVLSTLHCADASSAVSRIVDVFPEHRQSQVREQLAGSLRAVVTQRLLPTARGRGRAAAYELLRVTLPVAAKIRERRGHQLRSEIQKGQKDGMVPLEVTLAALVRQGRIREATARANAVDPNLFDEYLRRR